MRKVIRRGALTQISLPSMAATRLISPTLIAIAMPRESYSVGEVCGIGGEDGFRSRTWFRRGRGRRLAVAEGGFARGTKLRDSQDAGTEGDAGAKSDSTRRIDADLAAVDGGDAPYLANFDCNSHATRKLFSRRGVRHWGGRRVSVQDMVQERERKKERKEIKLEHRPRQGGGVFQTPVFNGQCHNDACQ